MASDARPPAGGWSTGRVAGAAAAGAMALLGLYLRASGGDDGATLPSLAPLDEQTYCYESVTTLADDVDGGGGPLGLDTAAVPRCFTVREGRFADVVDRLEQRKTAGTSTLPGHVIPGLWDGHGHLLAYGETLATANLVGAQDARTVRDRVRNHASTELGLGGPDHWLRGFGWDQMVMNGGVMPTAADLAADFPAYDPLEGMYVLLDRVDAHCVWVSQAVLDLIPPAELAQDVPGGQIVREPGLGVFCDNAMALVRDRWPQPGPAAKADYVRGAMAQMRRMGLVGVHDAGVAPADLQLYEALAGTADNASASAGAGAATGLRDPGWTLRVYAMVECAQQNGFCPDDVAALRRAPSDVLSIRSVKLFADGALGSWGSAMLAPYSDRPDTAGSLLVDAAALARLARDWAAAGFQVAIHAIGDRANRLAVDALEGALVALCPPDHPPAACQRDRFRFRIEHAQIVHPHDQARLHSLGLVPSVQPTHATSDMAYAERRLGPARTRDEAYRMRSFLHKDDHHSPLAPLVLGSDFPIEPPDPFQGLYAAVTRRSPHTGRGSGGADEGWHAEEALTLDEALVGFTRGPAYAAFLDGQAGVIQRGALADWVVLDRPLHDYALDDLRHLRVRETWVGGERVYARPDVLPDETWEGPTRK